MANTFTQLHIQFVFAVQFPMAQIHKGRKELLHKYITGIIQNRRLFRDRFESEEMKKRSFFKGKRHKQLEKQMILQWKKTY